MNSKTKNRGYLPGLDGWRAIAITAVLLDHMQPVGPSWFQHHFKTQGISAVWLFFAISGLLICSRLLEEESIYGRISLRNFYIRRSFRILPPAMTYLVAIALLGWMHVMPFDRPSWVAAMLFYRNYWNYFRGGISQSWFTGHFWSLSVEEHFYFLLPSIMLFLPRVRGRVLIGLTVVSYVWMYLFLVHSGFSYQLRGGSLPLFWDQRTEFCLPGLLVGAFFALWMSTRTVQGGGLRYLSPWVLCAVVLGLTMVWGESPRVYLVILAARIVLNPLLLMSTILHSGSLLTRFLELPPLKFVGRISYSVYLWQSLFLTRSTVYPGWIGRLQHPLIGAICTFVCAIASFYLIETPMIRLGRRFVTNRKKLDDPAEPNPLAA